jgi:hypothetical protein
MIDLKLCTGAAELLQRGFGVHQHAALQERIPKPVRGKAESACLL